MQLALSELWYMAGQLDGDGSINICGDKKNRQGDGVLSISMGKAGKSLSTLNSLKKIHGGRVNRNRKAKGKYQEINSWVKSGQDAIDFCQSIKTYVQLKHPQFDAASQFPLLNNNGIGFEITNDKDKFVFNSKNELMKKLSLTEYATNKWINNDQYPVKLNDKTWRLKKVDKTQITLKKNQIRAELKRLKTIPHNPINDTLPLEYFAGFFDAEGNIGVSNFNRIEVKVAQKYRAVCDAFKNKFGGEVCHQSNHAFSWYIKNYEGCMRFIDDILPYSIEKKQQLELVKNMPVNGAPEVAKKLREFKGNQGVGPKEKPERIAQKRLHGLPRYIGEVKGRSKQNNGQVIGYSVQWKSKMTKIIKPDQSLEQTLEDAKELVRKLVDGDISTVPRKQRDLPAYINYRSRSNVNTGYVVKYKKNPSKNFEGGGKSMDVLLEEAKQHLATLVAEEKLEKVQIS